jgi:hypothetical protein
LIDREHYSKAWDIFSQDFQNVPRPGIFTGAGLAIPPEPEPDMKYVAPKITADKTIGA